ncbi:MAG: hypothetical protein WD226_08020 [Planctomycetota bacterium]
MSRPISPVRPRSTAAESVAPSLGAPGRDAVVAAALFVVAVVLYATTWSGIYFHDAIMFLGLVDQGELLWFHLAYLPLCAGLTRVFELFGGNAESAMKWLSIVSGAGVVAGTFALVKGDTQRRDVALTVALAVLVAPSIWFGSTLVEIHVVAAFAVVLGVLVARRLAVPFGPAAGTAIAMVGHLSTLLLAPAIFVDASFRGRRPTWRALLVSGLMVVATVFTIRFLSELNANAPPAEFGGLPAFLRVSARELGRPDLFGQIWLQAISMWGLLLPLACLGVRWRTLVSLASVLGVVYLDFIHAGMMFGQYTTIVVPFVALLAGRALLGAHERWTRFGPWLIGGFLAAHLALSIPRALQVLDNEDERWAATLVGELPVPNRILASSRARRRVLQARGLAAHDFLHVPEHFEGPAAFEAWLANLLSSRTRVFVDPAVLAFPGDYPLLVPYVEYFDDEQRDLVRVQGLALFEIVPASR